MHMKETLGGEVSMVVWYNAGTSPHIVNLVRLWILVDFTLH
jgi:hypothetical protein